MTEVSSKFAKSWKSVIVFETWLITKLRTNTTNKLVKQRKDEKILCDVKNLLFIIALSTWCECQTEKLVAAWNNCFKFML